MTKFILIRGQQNSGKTTTAGLAYSELLKICEAKHIFNSKEVEINSLQYNKDTGALFDFTAILKLNSKSIGIISAGDLAEVLENEIKKFIKLKINLIICCSRSRNVKGSSYRMLTTKFSKEHNILKEIWVSYSPDEKDKLRIKAKSVSEITELIQVQLGF